MELQLDIGELEIEDINGINETELQAAISNALSQLIAENNQQFQFEDIKTPLQLNVMDLQFEPGSSEQEIAEQIAMMVVQRLSKAKSQ